MSFAELGFFSFSIRETFPTVFLKKLYKITVKQPKTTKQLIKWAFYIG